MNALLILSPFLFLPMPTLLPLLLQEAKTHIRGMFLWAMAILDAHMDCRISHNNSWETTALLTAFIFKAGLHSITLLFAFLYIFSVSSKYQ